MRNADKVNNQQQKRTPMKTKQTKTSEKRGVCPNCGQWQHDTFKGYSDCFNECVKRGFVAVSEGDMTPYTTVWTNHGEPVEIDEKHFGVSLQTESETDATRQAECWGQHDCPSCGKREIDNPLHSYFKQAQLVPTSKVEELIQERDNAEAQRDEWRAIAKKEASNCNELERENDELLAALNGLLARASTEFYQVATHDGILNCEAIAKARAAIAKVEGSK